MAGMTIGTARAVGGDSMATKAGPSEVEQCFSLLSDAIQHLAERAQELELRLDRCLAPDEPLPAKPDAPQIPAASQLGMEILRKVDELNAIARLLTRTRQRVML
jgi:hypothetical protein